MAVSADINWVAVILVKILCNILDARRIGDTIVISIVINTRGISTIARPTCLAVNHNLRI
jgi:hypothetical protein